MSDSAAKRTTNSCAATGRGERCQTLARTKAVVDTAHPRPITVQGAVQRARVNERGSAPSTPGTGHPGAANADPEVAGAERLHEVLYV